MIRPSLHESAADCPHEREVLKAIAINRIDLVEDHLAACRGCAELAELADALHQDYQATCREARVPSAGAVWWRATIRARAEAARTVSQPITVAQGVASAAAVGLGCGLAGMLWRSIPWASGATEFLARVSERSEMAPALALVVHYALPLTLGLAACLVAAPLALYLALSDE